MVLSVIIPVYNEEGTIRELLKRVLSVDMDKEVIVVDQSTDGTRDILRSMISHAPPHRAGGWSGGAWEQG